MKLPLEIIRIVSNSYQTEHVEDMFQKSARFQPLGSGVEILNHQKDQPHDFPVNKGQSEGEHEENQLVGLEPKHLEGLGEILRKLLVETIFIHRCSDSLERVKD